MNDSYYPFSRGGLRELHPPIHGGCGLCGAVLRHQTVVPNSLTTSLFPSANTANSVLDGSRLHQLTSYLELLHRRQLTIDEHTTLLLTAYIKLSAEDKLDEFVAKASSTTIDVDKAIELLRSAGYGKVAARLALANQKG